MAEDVGHGERVSRMRGRWGLRAKMAGSYVLVTAAAVLVLEIVVLVLVVPGLLFDASIGDRTVPVQLTAQDYAGRAAQAYALRGHLPDAGELLLGDPSLRLRPGEARAAPGGNGVLVPNTSTAQADTTRPMTVALLLDLDERIVNSSYPARYRVGASGTDLIPSTAFAKLRQNRKGAFGQSATRDGDVLWAVAPVFVLTDPGDPKTIDKSGALDPVGVVYVQVPASADLPARIEGTDRSRLWQNLSAQLAVGLLVLVVALPVGAVFGLFSTRRLIGRLRRLAASAVAVADGDYRHRVPVSGADEVAQLEANFNRMAERLADAMAAERQLAGASERARIARELHDSISQDLFSLRLLAGGLRRALPADSPLYPRVEAMERTASGTMHEMQALLLELRPVALRAAGLIPALDEVCRTYRDRLGVAVDAELDPVELDPAVEPAVLRVVQEALANAVKHARPGRIGLRVHREDGRVVVTVTDDGEGFDPAQAARRHGMGLELMRERVAELGGEFAIESASGRGTTVRIELPS
jgi:signal transduction histidine kinase